MNDAKKKIKVGKRKNKPTFHRQEYTIRPAFSTGWRRPTGGRSKLRKGIKERGRVPCSGFGSPVDVRGFHPSGMKEILITNHKDLDGLTNVVLRLSRTLGKRKKIEIMKRAEEMKLRVLNPVKDKKVSDENGKTK
jgi:large subunit ribosomal protein L32e